MMTPVTVRCRRRKFADERMRSPSGPANAITIKSAVVFITTDIVPSTTNCRKTCSRCAGYELWNKREKE